MVATKGIWEKLVGNDIWKKYIWKILFKMLVSSPLVGNSPGQKIFFRVEQIRRRESWESGFSNCYQGKLFYSLPGVTSPGWAGLSPWSSCHNLCLGKNLFLRELLKTWAGLTSQSRVVRVDPSWEARATTGGKYTPPSEASEKKLNVFMWFFRFLTPTSCVSTVLSWKLRMKTVQTTLQATITWIIRFQTTSSTNSIITMMQEK